jgi:hypothetical protein
VRAVLVLHLEAAQPAGTGKRYETVAAIVEK